MMLPSQAGPRILLLALFFFVAMAYSSVGHGGASGYLAVLSFFGAAPEVMAPAALCLNLLVAGISFVLYRREGHFVLRLALPFLLSSVPCALLGGATRVPPRLYMGLLAAVLVFAAWRLLWFRPGSVEESLLRQPRMALALPAGAAIGFLSGLIGVGGGIFLSPLMILMKWADAKRTSAASAAFIWVNSLAGLYGHLQRRAVDWPALLWLAAAACAGGLAGSHLGAARFGGHWLRRILGLVLLVAAVKLARTAFG